MMLIRNRTTIEDVAIKEDQDLGLDPGPGFDRGWIANIKEVLGENMLLWWMPQMISSDDRDILHDL